MLWNKKMKAFFDKFSDLSIDDTQIKIIEGELLYKSLKRKIKKNSGGIKMNTDYNQQFPKLEKLIYLFHDCCKAHEEEIITDEQFIDLFNINKGEQYLIKFFEPTNINKSYFITEHLKEYDEEHWDDHSFRFVVYFTNNHHYGGKFALENYVEIGITGTI